MPLLKVNQIASYSGNTLTIGTTGDTVTLAAGSTSSGFGATYNGAVNWTSNIVTSALTLSAGVGYFVNTSSAAITATLPASPTVGSTIAFSDYNRTFATNNLTLGRNGSNFQGQPVNPVYATNGQSITITYADSTKGWIPVVDDDVTDKVSYSVDFLIIAGGGGGGSNGPGANQGGGGGAGGYRTSTQSVIPGTVITVTVGDGGAGATTTTVNQGGAAGSTSSISGTGLTTITSAGGGGGTNAGSTVGFNGGSGGGSGGSGTGGSGNVPSTSPSQGNNGGSVTGGGGGAGAVGSTGPTPNGVGGTGVASSITGSSVTRAGGGGGGSNDVPGGSGGGGRSYGPSQGNTGQAGTANTGGGGGAGYVDGPGLGGAGGKGVVILSVPTTNYSGTTSGSPTVTTSGSNTIMQFNGSGSYTA